MLTFFYMYPDFIWTARIRELCARLVVRKRNNGMTFAEMEMAKLPTPVSPIANDGVSYSK